MGFPVFRRHKPAMVKAAKGGNIMKSRKNYLIAAALGSTLLIGISFLTTKLAAYANNIIITGDASETLKITSENRMLFDLTGLYPGDTSASSCTISNTNMANEGFEVFMYATNTTDAEYDLGQVTKLTVFDGETTIYNGMLIGLEAAGGSEAPISLGRVARGTSKNVDFVIEIDGEKADNNYQGQPSNFVVTFLANEYGVPGPTPGPGGGGGGGETVTFSTLGPAPAVREISIIPDEEVPLIIPVAASPDIPADEYEPQEPETIEIDDEEVPLIRNIKEMPKTDEVSLTLYIVPGAIIICCGLFVIMRKGKKKAGSTVEVRR